MLVTTTVSAPTARMAALMSLTLPMTGISVAPIVAPTWPVGMQAPTT